MVWYLTDYQNSVIMIVDYLGASLGSKTYDGFGNILTNTIGVNDDRFGFTSREWDSAVSLQYSRARYYGPGLGKWTSTDPLGFAAGDANLYRYVANGPTNGVDPSGLETLAGSGHTRPSGTVKKRPSYTISGGIAVGGSVGGAQIGGSVEFNVASGPTKEGASVTGSRGAPTSGFGLGFGIMPYLMVTNAADISDLNGDSTVTGGAVPKIAVNHIKGSNYDGVAIGYPVGPGASFYGGQQTTVLLLGGQSGPIQRDPRPASRGGAMTGPSCK